MYSLLWLSCGSEVKEPEPIAADVSLYGQGENQLSRDLLERSLELGTSFLLHNQKEQGNFQYEYDFVKRRYNPNDSQVRQAGALWVLIWGLTPTCPGIGGNQRLNRRSTAEGR